MDEKKEEIEKEENPIPEESEDSVGEEGVEVEKISTEELSSILASHNKEELARIFEEVPDIDIAEAADKLEVEELIRMFRDVPSEMTANVFDELAQDTKENLIKAMTDKELVKLLNEQYADDLADTVGDMPANLASRVLKNASKDMREDLNELLKYKKDTAGAIMTTEYLEFRESTKVEDTIDLIRKKGRDAETVYTIFVRDNKRKFVGTVDLDDLIFAEKDQTLSDIMNVDIPNVHANTDKEEVANLFRRYDLNAIAVLNDDDCLIGIVTIDDAVDVMTQESTEDIEKMNAVTPIDDSYLETHPFTMAKKCVPWIVVLLILGTFSSMVLSQFQDKIAALSILSAFIPVLMDTGGNAGGQTIALVIRGLALKEFNPRQTAKILWQEFRSSLIIAFFISLFAVLWFTLEQMFGIVSNPQIFTGQLAIKYGVSEGTIGTIFNGLIWNWDWFSPTLRVSFVVAGTLFIAVVVSKMFAVLLPMGAAAIKKDPAIVSQPVLTTIVDVTSLLIYFGIAELLLLNPPWGGGLI
ncbi:MAG: magnesium transporter [Bacilli bacterium]|nr:magnesium transporter [Bacilli bacterium]